MGWSVTVTRLLGPKYDSNGDPANPPKRQIVIAGAAIAPRSSANAGISEHFDRGREGVTEGVSLYAPGSPDIQRLDEVEHMGVTYLAGSPLPWTSPYGGALNGVEVPLERSEG